MMLGVLPLALASMFVATDPLGTVPLFLSLASGLDKAGRRRVVLRSGTTAAAVGVAFFALIGLTVADFMVAGGLLLLVIALVELVHGSLAERIATGRRDSQ